MKKIAISLYIFFIIIISSLFFLGISHSRKISYDLSRFGISEGFSVIQTNNSLHLDDSPELSGFFLDSHLIILPAGEYLFTIDYQADSINKVHFQANNDVFVEVELPEGHNIIEIPISLQTATENGKFRFTYNGAGQFDLFGISCSSEHLLFTDYIFYLILFLFANVFILIFYKNREKWHINAVKIYTFLFLSILSIITIPYMALWNNGLYMATDMVFHASRIESIKDALLERQLPAVIYPNMCNEYGSIGTAYPSLFLYGASILRILHVSTVCVYKFYTILINFFILASAFYSTLYLSKSRRTSVVATLTFAFSIYHLDMVGYKNWTLGMGIATIFIFFIICGLYNILFDNQKKWYLIAIGMTGIINSHIMASLMISFCIALICIIFIRKIIKEQRFLSFIKSVILSIFLNAATLYMFFDALTNNLNTQKLQWTSFGTNTYSLGECLSSPINIYTIFCFCIVVFYLIKKRNNKDYTYHYICAFFYIDFCLFLFTTQLFPWEQLLSINWINTIFNYIQFPVRLYIIIMPTLSLITAISFERCSLFTGKKYYFILGLFMTLSFINYTTICSEYDGSVKAITKSVLGDVFSTHSSDDYLPSGADSEWYNNPYPDYSSYDDSIVVSNYTKYGTRIFGTYTCTKAEQYLDFPLFYYKGYQCIDDNGNEIPLYIGTNNKIRILLEKTNPPIQFTIFYSVPTIYKILTIFSFLVFLFFILWLFRNASLFSNIIHSKKKE